MNCPICNKELLMHPILHSNLVCIREIEKHNCIYFTKNKEYYFSNKIFSIDGCLNRDKIKMDGYLSINEGENRILYEDLPFEKAVELFTKLSKLKLFT